MPERAGYLLKERVSDIAVLADALRRIDEGECVVDPTIVSRLVTRKRERGPLNDLSDRELEVLALVAEGHSNGAIGEKLFLSRKTVESHISKIFAKLDLGQSPGSPPARAGGARLPALVLSGAARPGSGTALTPTGDVPVVGGPRARLASSLDDHSAIRREPR